MGVSFVSAILFLQTKGRLGLALYGAMLGLCTLCCLPTTPIEVGAGYIWSASVAGTTLSGCLGKTMGCITAFIFGRALSDQLQLRRRTGMTGVLGSKIEAMLRKRPIQTIGMIRGAPMPGALKNFGLSLFPPDVVPLHVFALTTLAMNLPFSIAWSLAGSSCSSLQEAMSGGGNQAKTRSLLMQLTAVLLMLGGMAAIARHYRVHELMHTDATSPPQAQAPPAAEVAKAEPRPPRSASARQRHARSPARSSPRLASARSAAAVC